MISWFYAYIRKCLLNLQFWTQTFLTEKDKLENLRLPNVPIFLKFLGLGEFARKYGDNLLVLLDNSRRTTPPVPQNEELVSPSKRGRKSRRSSKGKEMIKEEPTPIPYDSFIQDQFRFLEQAHLLDLDFVFENYLPLLSTNFSDDLFVTIAPKSQQNIYTNGNLPTLTPAHVPTPPTNSNSNDSSDINLPDADTNQAIISDNSNDGLSSSQSSQSLLTPQSSFIQMLPSSQPPATPQIIYYVDKDSTEYETTRIGCDALDAMAMAADSFSARDLLAARPHILNVVV